MSGAAILQEPPACLSPTRRRSHSEKIRNDRPHSLMPFSARLIENHEEASRRAPCLRQIKKEKERAAVSFRRRRRILIAKNVSQVVGVVFDEVIGVGQRSPVTRSRKSMDCCCPRSLPPSSALRTRTWFSHPRGPQRAARLVAVDWNTTTRPSAEIEGSKLSPFPSSPFVRTETQVVVPVVRSCTKI